MTKIPRGASPSSVEGVDVFEHAEEVGLLDDEGGDVLAVVLREGLERVCGPSVGRYGTSSNRRPWLLAVAAATLR